MKTGKILGGLIIAISVLAFLSVIIVKEVNQAIYFQIAWSKTVLKDYEGAIKSYSKGIDIDKDNPNNYYSYEKRGETKVYLGDLNGGIKDFTKSIVINPKNAFAYAKRGDAKRSQENYKDALSDINKAIDLDSKQSWFYRVRGYVNYYLDEPKNAVSDFLVAIEKVKKIGGEIIYGGSVIDSEGFFIKPTIVKAKNHWEIVQEETFSSILYIMTYDTLEEAVQIHNNVPQGLSSSMFTLNIRNAEYFLSSVGSDCGIANINIGTSGAEIGGAFGGEKETGGGRESGSDSWKQYMRRQTNTINWSEELPLAQGIKFEFGD